MLKILLYIAIFCIIAGGMILFYLQYRYRSKISSASSASYDISFAFKNPDVLNKFKEGYQKSLAEAGQNLSLRQTIRPGEHSGKIGTLSPGQQIVNRRTLIGTNARVIGAKNSSSIATLSSNNISTNSPANMQNYHAGIASSNYPSNMSSSNYAGNVAASRSARKSNVPWTPIEPGSEELLRSGLNELPTMPINMNKLDSNQVGSLQQNPLPNLSSDQSITVKNVAVQPQTAIPTNPFESNNIQVIVQKISAPLVVEQDSKDIKVTINVSNYETFPIKISKNTLKFYKERQDISTEYEVYEKNKDTIEIRANETEELVVYATISKHATLGNIMVIPVVLAQFPNGKVVPAQFETAKIFQWRVEPLVGRVFQITTEHNGVEIAGVPFSVSLQLFCNNVIDKDYNGEKIIHFSLNNVTQYSYQIQDSVKLNFIGGVAKTPSQFSFFNTLESYILSAKDKTIPGLEGSSDTIVLKPGELGSFRIEISSPQRNNVNLEGTNTLTAIDVYGNVKTDYTNDTLLNSDQGSVKGLTNNIIPAKEFQQGVVNLTSLKIRIFVAEFHQEGKIIRLKARNGNKSGNSNEITIMPANSAPPEELSVSATEFTIRRLCGYRRKHLWVVNTDPVTTREFTTDFQKDYELIFRNLTHQDLDSLVANHPDILFLDVENNREEGYQLMRDIRQLPNMDSLPIFVLGPGTESESQISSVIRSGCIYVTKPVSTSAIRATLVELLQNLSIEQGQMPIRGARIQGSEGLTYQIISKIGEGGMGYIYEAKRLRDQKRVIMKYLPPRDVKNIKSVMRFLQEAHTVLSFYHQNLVMGYDMLLDRNRCFYVMEFIDGRTLEKVIQQERRIAPDKAVRIILQVARALQCLDEEHHLVHRDIKPSNILVMDDGLVKLVDFGIAKISNHHLTTAGIILGTPYYLSPEQITGQEVTIQSDIYSLGATFYHMVTGTHPFQGSDVYTIVQQRLNRDPVDPRHYSAALPKSIAQIIMRMMNQKPNNRYSPVGSLISELERVLEGMESGAIPFA